MSESAKKAFGDRAFFDWSALKSENNKEDSSTLFENVHPRSLVTKVALAHNPRAGKT